MGLIDGHAVWIWHIRNERGERVRPTFEGIEPLDDEDGKPLQFALVADMDQPDQSALIGALETRLGRTGGTGMQPLPGRRHPSDRITLDRTRQWQSKP